MAGGCRKTARPTRFVLCLAALLGLRLFRVDPSAGPQLLSGALLVVSDLHYNGSTNPAIPTSPCPGYSRIATWASFNPPWRTRTNVVRTPCLCWCLGDVLAHASLRPRTFDPRTEQASVARMFRAEFPNTPVFAVLGNNDSEQDHELQSADFLAAWSESWSPLLKAARPGDGFKQNFPAHGWFAADVPGRGGLSGCWF